MLFPKKSSVALLLIGLFVLAGCSGQKKINVDETYLKLKPAAPLPEVLTKKQPHNLIIHIGNVADMSSSYKNRLQLYVNDHLIRPNEVSNVKSNYHYALRLQPGFYDVKAVYYASTGWVEKSFDIIPRDRVMVFEDKQTILNVVLQKDSWGAPVDKVTYFDMSVNPLQTAVK